MLFSSCASLSRFLAALFAAASLLLFPATAFGQAPPADDEAQVRVGVRGDSAFVYHTARLPLHYGFHVERAGAGGAFERLTETPMRAVQDPRLLVSRLGPRYDALERSLEVNSPDAVFFKLRAARSADLFASFAYPSVARAMGRLFVDEAAPVGEAVTYRIVFVDGLGNPTGRTLERTVDRLREVPAPAPRDVEVGNEGERIRIAWTYPLPPGGEGDQVLRFELLRRDPATGRNVPVVPDRTLLRNEAQREFFYFFQARATGRTEVYTVAAVQMTGRYIESEPVEYFVEDNVAPQPVAGLEAYFERSEQVELSWRLSPEPDVEGYRVFRAQRLTGTFDPIHEGLLSTLQTTYLDTTARGRRNYYYKIVTADSSGNRSRMSNPVMARVKDEAAPPAPQRLDVQVERYDEVTLTWDAGAGDALPAGLLTYEILYRRASENDDDAWAKLNSDSYFRGVRYPTGGPTDAGFAEGARYQFGVAAVDSSLNRSDTAFVEVKIPDLTPPAPPARVTARNEGGVRALVRWDRSTDRDVSTYVLRRRPATRPAPSDTATIVVARTGPGDTYAQDDGVETGRAYVYTVSAIDSLGNEGVPSEPVRFEMADLNPPPAPRRVEAAAQPGGGALIAWSPVPGGDVAGYRVYQSDLATGIFEPVTEELVTATRFEHAAGEAGRFYRIYSVDTAGNASDASDPAVARPAQ